MIGSQVGIRPEPSSGFYNHKVYTYLFKSLKEPESTRNCTRLQSTGKMKYTKAPFPIKEFFGFILYTIISFSQRFNIPQMAMVSIVRPQKKRIGNCSNICSGVQYNRFPHSCYSY